jgi:hypothetical protein
VSDYGFREYQILHTRVTAATTHVEITSAAARVTKFVQGEDHNPVYCERLVNALMSKALDVISDVVNEWGQDVYALMATRIIVKNVRTTVEVWRRTMEHNDSTPEG